MVSGHQGPSEHLLTRMRGHEVLRHQDQLTTGKGSVLEGGSSLPVARRSSGPLAALEHLRASHYGQGQLLRLMLLLLRQRPVAGLSRCCSGGWGVVEGRGSYVVGGLWRLRWGNVTTASSQRTLLRVDSEMLLLLCSSWVLLLLLTATGCSWHLGS